MHAYQVDEEIANGERERLILEHLPQVRLIARRIQERLPENISLDDLISTGVIGLISAIDHFDPKHNVKLKTYAEYKIRGAILDSLRGLDWAPRQKRKKAKRIEAAISAAEQRLHRSPSEDEVAAELKLSLDEYHEWLVEIRGVNIGSFEYAGGGDDHEDARSGAQCSFVLLQGRADVARNRDRDEPARIPRVAVEIAGDSAVAYLHGAALADRARCTRREPEHCRIAGKIPAPGW